MNTGFAQPPFWKDASFRRFLAENPELLGIEAYLPPRPGAAFPGQEQIERLESSYKSRGYQHLFYALARVLKPLRCVEIGVLQGFSLLTLGAALRDNGFGVIQGYDLFEEYPFRHERFEAVAERIRSLGLQDYAGVQRADAFDVRRLHPQVDLLHVDISNNGGTYRRIFQQWAGAVTRVILFEGGSAERDQVEWMVKYRKPPIIEALEELKPAYPEWRLSVLDPHPSATIAVRKASQP